MNSKDKDKLLRIAFYEDKLIADPTGRAKGRGVYLCRNKECLQNAFKKKGFNRSFKTGFSTDTLEALAIDMEKEITRSTDE